MLERLERREVPATCTFIGADTGGTWSNLLNWQGGVAPMPGRGDIVLIGAAAVGNNSVADIPGLDVAEVRVEATYQAGNFIVQSDLRVDTRVTQSEATVTVAPGATLFAREYRMTRGTLDGDGTVFVYGNNPAQPGVFRISGIANSTLVGVANLTIDGAARMELDAATWFDTTTITNYGQFEWSQGNQAFDNGAGVVNRGTFTINSARNFGDSTGALNPGSFVNWGRVERVAGAAARVFLPYYAKPGSVTWIDIGILEFREGGDLEGAFEVDQLTRLTFRGGAYNLLAGASFSGDGVVELLTDGAFAIPQGGSVTSTAPLHFDTVGTALTGQGSFTATNGLTWIDGEVENLAQFDVYGAFSLEGTLTKVLRNTTLKAHGTTTWQDSGDIRVIDSAFENFGTFNITNDRRVEGEGTGLFRNAGGTVEKTDGTGQTTFNLPVETAGNLLLAGRKMQFLLGLVQSGGPTSFTELTGGILTLGANTEYRIDGGTLKGNGTISGSLNNAAGIVAIGEDETRRSLVVTGNYIQGLGTLRVYARDNSGWGVLDISGTASLAGTLEMVEIGTVPAGSQIIVNASGGLTGTFTTVIGQGWSASYGFTTATATKSA